ncbi:MAG: LCP family protein [Actinomycetota bacterium]
MSARRRLVLLMTALMVASMLAWTGLSLSPASGASGKPVLIRRVHNGYFRPEPERPVFILALGSDQGAERYKRFGPADRGRADSIHIIAINPKEKAGTIVGIPRDTFVSVGGFSGKINGAMASGGPERMVRVVEEFTGITLDYYIVTSFSGFEDMVNELGGVVVDVPYKVHDPQYSNADFEKGQQVLGGFQALAFARNRHSARRGDFSRSENQGLILLGALRRARAETFTTPGKMLDYLRIFFKYVATDLSVDEALQLGMLAVRLQTPDVRNVVMDGQLTSTIDGASIIRATQAVKAMFADVADDAILSDPDKGVATTR